MRFCIGIDNLKNDFCRVKNSKLHGAISINTLTLKTMEKISNSAFSKFAGKQITNLHTIVGGAYATGGGFQQLDVDCYIAWDYDIIDDNNVGHTSAPYQITASQAWEKMGGNQC
jgi:hypothetical protein